MAALLPHSTLTVEPKADGRLGVLADGQSTESNNRDRVLKGANPNSIALQYKSIVSMKRADRQNLVKATPRKARGLKFRQKYGIINPWINK